MVEINKKTLELNREELLKLSPDERIKKIKDFEEQKKKELENELAETKRFLDENEKELNLRKSNELTSELLRRKIEEDRIAQKSLEQTVAEEAIPRKEDLPPQAEYKHVSYMADMYTQLKNILDTGIPLNPYERQKVEDIYQIINQLADLHPQKLQHAESIDEIAQATKRIVKTLLGDYQSNVKYTP